MMEIVGVPGMSHKWIRDIRKQSIYERILLVQDAAHVDMLVHHQGVCAHGPALHSHMENSMPPVEIVEQVNCGRVACGQVQEEMTEHNDISVDAHYSASPTDVGVDNPFSQEW